MNSLPKKSKFLISGTNSGLGKSLLEVFGGSSWNRDITLKDKKKLVKKGVDIIIHCAFNSQKKVDSDNLYNYFSDNVLLTQELLNIPHKKFIFISTVDVYPKNGKKHNEDEIINLDEISGIYPITKLISESLIKEKNSIFLILRCSAMLGKYSRKNSLIKIIEDENPTLTLSGNSEMNYILHADVADFIKVALEKNLTGIFNLVSSKNIKLKEVEKLLNKKVNFGNYKYKVEDMENHKVVSVCPIFSKKSEGIIREFIR